MRGILAAAAIATGLHLPAGAQTDPVKIDGIDWVDCLALISDHVDAYLERKGTVLGEIDREKVRSVAVALDKELIVLRCKKRFWRADFSIDVAPL